MVLLANGPPPVASTHTTLFSFDDHSLPNLSALRVNLVEAHRHNHEFPNPAFAQSDCRVLAPGPKGSSDDALVIYYGESTTTLLSPDRHNPNVLTQRRLQETSFRVLMASSGCTTWVWVLPTLSTKAKLLKFGSKGRHRLFIYLRRV